MTSNSKLSQKKKGSANRAKAKYKVAKLHAKIADSRLDNLHKLSRKLINDNQVVCIETLAVKSMIKNPKLAKQIADAGWGDSHRFDRGYGRKVSSLLDQK